MITVSSCGVQLQEVFSGLEKKAKILDIHVHFCGFSQQSFLLFSFPLGCNYYYCSPHRERSTGKLFVVSNKIVTEERRRTKNQGDYCYYGQTDATYRNIENTHYTQLHNQRHNEQYQYGY